MITNKRKYKKNKEYKKMIIDAILDRKDLIENGSSFYNEEDTLKYMYDMAVLHDMQDLSRALDSGSDDDIKKALAKYIIDNDYNVDIIQFVYSVQWLNECFY